MTVDTDTPDLPALPDIAEDAQAKPVRRKRAVKPATEEGMAAGQPGSAPAAAEVPVEAVTPAEATELPVAKPARRRRAAVSTDPEVIAPGSADVPVQASLALDTPVPAAPETAASEQAVAVGDNPTSADEGSGPERADTEEGGDAAGEEGAGGRARRRRKDRPSRAERERRAAEAGGAAPAETRPPLDASADVGASDDDDEDEGGPEDAAPRPVPADPGEVFAQVVSGEFDAGDSEELPEPPAPHKRVLLPEPDAPKLQKVLAQSGIGSRRDMETLIQEGLVSVNGEPAHIGQRISFGDRIQVKGKPIRVRIVPPPPRIIAYHKPVGEVVTHDDPQQRPTVFRRLPRLPQGKWQSVGRLDLNTEGLLLFTNSGELANQLMHPRFGVEREYAVRVLGKLDEMDKAQLLEGVNIDGQTASFRSIEDGGGEGANHWYRVVITEGRNREVRKLFDAVELTVSRLIRIRYGTVVLPRGLKRGVWVDLDPVDVKAIRQLAGGGARQEAPRPGQAPNGKQQDRGRNKPRGERPDRPDRPPQAQGPRPQGGGHQGPRPPQAPRHPAEAQAMPERERDRHDDLDDDFDPSRIPNPLEQTFDKRFVQNPRSPAGGRGFGRGGGGFGAGGSAPPPSAPRKPGAPREPDPLQTSVGYIGADAFHRKSRSGGGGGNRGGGFGGGGGNRGGGGGKRGR